MSEQRVLRAIKSRTKTLSFNNCDLKSLPPALGRLDFLTSLSAKNNGLKTLPQEISNLSSVRPLAEDITCFMYPHKQLCYLNLGCNELADCSLPLLQALLQLTTLHLFSNHLYTIPEPFFSEL